MGLSSKFEGKKNPRLGGIRGTHPDKRCLSDSDGGRVLAGFLRAAVGGTIGRCGAGRKFGTPGNHLGEHPVPAPGEKRPSLCRQPRIQAPLSTPRERAKGEKKSGCRKCAKGVCREKLRGNEESSHTLDSASVAKAGRGIS